MMQFCKENPAWPYQLPAAKAHAGQAGRPPLPADAV